MARAKFVKSARKDNVNQGIKKGDSYWWWSFRFGGKRYSKTPPRRSQLTQSSFLGTMYDAEDDLSKAVAEFSAGQLGFDELADACESAALEIRDAGDECDSSRENMPEGLKEGGVGELLGNRKEQADQLADELENAAEEIRSLTPEEDKEENKDEDEVSSEVQAAIDAVEAISWEYE